jgi:hypothetical protein
VRLHSGRSGGSLTGHRSLGSRGDQWLPSVDGPVVFASGSVTGHRSSAMRDAVAGQPVARGGIAW